MLAALYALKDRLDREHNAFSASASFASAPAPAVPQTLRSNGDSEFLRAVEGKSWEEVLPVIDELLAAVKVLQPQLYGAFLRRL